MDADHSEREQNQDLSDQRQSLAERISVLQRTQESVYPSPLAASGGQGNSLAENLERQIRRRRTQLSNLEHSRSAAEVSVIRHTSTPHEQSREDLNIVGENISGIQAPGQNPDPVPQPRPFQIYLDNPEEISVVLDSLNESKGINLRELGVDEQAIHEFVRRSYKRGFKDGVDFISDLPSSLCY